MPIRRHWRCFGAAEGFVRQEGLSPPRSPAYQRRRQARSARIRNCAIPPSSGWPPRSRRAARSTTPSTRYLETARRGGKSPYAPFAYNSVGAALRAARRQGQRAQDPERSGGPGPGFPLRPRRPKQAQADGRFRSTSDDRSRAAQRAPHGKRDANAFGACEIGVELCESSLKIPSS